MQSNGLNSADNIINIINKILKSHTRREAEPESHGS